MDPYRHALLAHVPTESRRTFRGRLRSFMRRVRIWFATSYGTLRTDTRRTIVWDVGSRRLRMGSVAIEEIQYLWRGKNSIRRQLWVSSDGIIWRHSKTGERAYHEHVLEEFYEAAKFRDAVREH